MQDTITQMNELVESWKRLFDPCDVLHLCFTQTPDETICLNDTKTFPIKDTLLSSAHISITRIRFSFTSGEKIVLSVGWPEDQGPQLKSTLYCTRQLHRYPVNGPIRWPRPFWLLPPRRDPPNWAGEGIYQDG